MKKVNVVSMILGTIGGILFALGMCMCLLPEWNAMKEGIAAGTIGIVVLLAMVAVRRRMLNKPAIRVNRKMILRVLYGILAALVFGTGMCMTMVWSGMMVSGIFVGIIGMVMLLAMIPMCKGIQ